MQGLRVRFAVLACAALAALWLPVAADARAKKPKTIVTDLGGAEIAEDVAAAGKRVVAAGTRSTGGQSDFVLAGYTRKGKLARSFGDRGVVVTDIGGIDRLNDLLRLPGGRFLAGG